MNVKTILKRVLPVTIHRFCMTMELIQKELQIQKNIQQGIISRLDGIEKVNNRLSDRIDCMLLQQEKHMKFTRIMNDRVLDGIRFASEAVWAAIFNNTIVNSEWLVDKQFSPGRWAVRYQTLYVIYRILNEVRPNRILELGLGQSTRMTAQYSRCFHIQHEVVEHDQNWIDFFSNSFKMIDNTQIIKLDREFIRFRDADNVRVFKGFKDAFDGKHYNFIIIDAPLGGDMKQYSRVDICRMLPDVLEEKFIILVDDANRAGEANTIMAMEEILTQNGIKYMKGKYSGQNDCVVICSEDLGFVTSM